MGHSALVGEILIAVSARFPTVRLWKNQTGVAISADGLRPIAFGLKGSADILGIAGPSGRFVALEIKVGRDRQSSAQLAFERMVTSLGGVYRVCRSVDDAIECLAPIAPSHV